MIEVPILSFFFVLNFFVFLEFYRNCLAGLLRYKSIVRIFWVFCIFSGLCDVGDAWMESLYKIVWLPM